MSILKRFCYNNFVKNLHDTSSSSVLLS